MRVVLICVLLFSFCAHGDQAADRAAIDRVIVSTNDPSRRAALFTRDYDSAVDFDRLIELHLAWSRGPRMIGMDEPWRELTTPVVVSGPIRFITADVAVVNGASVVRGAATIPARVPLTFIVLREGSEWRISVVRTTAPRQRDDRM